jgi:hypothetical protein
MCVCVCVRVHVCVLDKCSEFYFPVHYFMWEMNGR